MIKNFKAPRREVGISSVIVCLPGMHEALGLITSTTKQKKTTLLEENEREKLLEIKIDNDFVGTKSTNKKTKII